MATNEKGPNVTELGKGLNTDFSPQIQPDGTYRFALNTVDEAELGDSMYRSNEEGNEVSVSLPTGYTPIGKRYIGNGDTVLFLVKGLDSMIGLFNEEGKFTILVDDSLTGLHPIIYQQMPSVNKLNFSIEHQIDCIYRLRRGCERTIYFTDDYNAPRYYNIDKYYNFLNYWGVIDADLFKLFRVYKNIPRFSSIEILEEGLLPSGSYNIAIQYIDDDLNPTEWMTVSDTIIIYNDKIDKEFSDIRGSTNAVNSYQNFGPTNKAIRVTVDNMDMSFSFYRLALVEANNGSGQITKVTASANLSTKSNIFTFNGNNGVSVITEDEVAAFGNSVEKVAHIEQLENRLLLSKIKNKSIDWYKLQSYASKIRTDLVLQNIDLSALIENNPKNGLVHTQNLGYMPGEIYSMGIVYIFDDGSTSPVFHIPGGVPSQPPLSGILAMDYNNTCTTAKYTSLSEKCNIGNYWGVDYMGNPLINTRVRHHRFPLRSKINSPLINKVIGNPFKIYLNIVGTNAHTDLDIVVAYHLQIGTGSWTSTEESYTFNELDYPAGSINEKILLHSSHTKIIATIESSIVVNSLSCTLTYEYEKDPDTVNADIYGFKFSNVELPPSTIINEHQIVGYYIVRNERTENEKTILDSGVLIPTVNDSKNPPRFLAHGFLLPEGNSNRIKTDIVGLINPEFKFNKREYKNFDLIQEGYYRPTSKALTALVTQDVQPGTSYDPTINVSHDKDTDGFDLRTFARDSTLIYEPYLGSNAGKVTKVNETFYLNALSTVPIKDNAGTSFEVYNIACDNTIGILSLDDNISYDTTKKLPYVLMKRNIGDNYSTFQTLPYFLESEVLSASEATIFHGDSYISPMKYHNSIFYDMTLTARGTKDGTWKIITGIALTVAAIAVTVLTLGAATAAGIALGTIAAGLLVVGAGILLTTSGLEMNNLAKVYNELYKQGLNECVEDADTGQLGYFGPHDNPTLFTNNSTGSDDEIRWFSDTLSDLWFESSVNMSWRKGSSIGLTDFLNTPKVSKTWENDITGDVDVTGEIDAYMLDKLTVVDAERDSGRLYKGYAGAEIYEVNLDYFRRNKQKIYFALGIEYDCCSNCNEEFPHRTMYSEQSFQEELTDNYRVFLPNNYRDLDGETGVITNMFKIQNSLFIHTEEGLWNIPKNYQERVTGQIVSFLGTGSYFDIPPQRIVDDSNGNSAGNLHKWGTAKTPYSYFFVCERQGCIYMFNGQKLQAITDNGIKNDMSYRIPMAINEQMPIGQRYEYDDNPSNPIGTGFIATYDSKKDRVIFTKKDFKYVAGLSGSIYNKSWTISYSPKNQSFTSWHSYLPSFYINTAQDFFSWIPGRPTNEIWKHGSFGKYQNFYGEKKPFIIEMVSKGNPLVNNIWDALHIIAEVKKYDPTTKEFYDVDNKFFNKAIFYNSRQCSGELNIVVKDKETLDYIMDQVQNTNMNDIIASRNERDWSINELRDFRKDYKKPIFKSDDASVQSEYFIDKVVNYGDANSILGFDKDWTELESFRDKYLVIRLIFDNFDNYKLLLNYSIENETQSFR